MRRGKSWKMFGIGIKEKAACASVACVENPIEDKCRRWQGASEHQIGQMRLYQCQGLRNRNRSEVQLRLWSGHNVGQSTHTFLCTLTSSTTSLASTVSSPASELCYNRVSVSEVPTLLTFCQTFRGHRARPPNIPDILFYLIQWPNNAPQSTMPRARNEGAMRVESGQI
jgi:hypothetical protein